MKHAAASRRLAVLATAAALIAAHCGRVAAQQAAPLARETAPFNITGYWVSLITEEWVQRMTTPPPGDYRFLPLNAAGRALADSWSPAADEAAGEACKGYAAPAIMRLPSRLQIGWEDDMTLRIDIDTGTQRRLFHFDRTRPPEAPSWQGHSTAQWAYSGPQRDVASPASADRQATLHVDTTNLRPGYLQKNGVPFSEAAFMTEYYNLIVADDGTEYLVVQAFVDDPLYLSDHWVRTVQFRREPNGEGFNPTTCSAY
jgi:hypothetical protein